MEPNLQCELQVPLPCWEKATVPVPSHLSSKDPPHSHGLLHPPHECFLLILAITIFPSYGQDVIFALVITDNRHNFPASHAKSDFLAVPLPQRFVSAGDQAPHHPSLKSCFSIGPLGTLRKPTRVKCGWKYLC